MAFAYTGLNPEEMEGRITTVFERLVTTVTNDEEHIESTTNNGQSIIRIFHQPALMPIEQRRGSPLERRRSSGSFPTGTQPPVLINYSASTVPYFAARPQDKDSPSSN